MDNKYVTIKIKIGTRPTLRKVSAETGESIMAVVERLASEELARLKEDSEQGSKEQ